MFNVFVYIYIKETETKNIVNYEKDFFFIDLTKLRFYLIFLCSEFCDVRLAYMYNT